MKTRTLKTSVGIVAVAALVGMNLFHAWNNYGIKDSSMLLSIKATPADDDKETECDTKPGFSEVYHDKKAGTFTHHKPCVIARVYLYYETCEHGHRHHIATERVYLADGRKEMTYPDGETHSTDGIQPERGEDEEKEFEYDDINCEEKEKGSCCYPEKKNLNCEDLIRSRS